MKIASLSLMRDWRRAQIDLELARNQAAAERAALRNAIAAKARATKRMTLDAASIAATRGNDMRWREPPRVSLPVLKFLQTPFDGDRKQGAEPLRVTAPRILESDDKVQIGSQSQEGIST